MNADRSRNILRCAFVLAPLLAACGDGGGGSGGTINLPSGGLTLPDCQDGQILITNSAGKVDCANPPSKSVSLPGSCASDKKQALFSNGTALNCVDVPADGSTNAQNTRIDNLMTKITDLTNKANNLTTSGGGVKRFVGVTTNAANKLNGNMQNGTDNGFTGAAKACNAEYAGSRMCTIMDIYNSVISGDLSSTKNITSLAWVYAPAWKNPIAGSVDANNGQGDTCGSLTYPTGDKKWTGTAITTGINAQTTRWGVNIQGGSNVPCSTTLPIACCK